MFDSYFRKDISWGGKTLTLETGKIARQADGAVMARLGDTIVLCTAVGARNVRGAQPAACGGSQVVAVGGHHHDFRRLEAERFGCGQVDHGLGLVVAGDLRAQDRVPSEVVAPRQIDQEVEPRS